MKNWFFVWFCLTFATFAQTDNNNTFDISVLLERQKVIDKELSESSVWYKVYSNYHTYQELAQKQTLIEAEIKELQKRRGSKEQLERLKKEQETIEGKLELLKDYKDDPFRKLLAPTELEAPPVISNPIAIISALSYLRKLKTDQDEYSQRYKSLEKLVDTLTDKQALLEEIVLFDTNDTLYTEELQNTTTALKSFVPLLDIFKTTHDVYIKKIDETSMLVNSHIKKELQKLIGIGAILLLFLFLIVLIKYLVRRYMSDTERFYIINKALNITFATLLVLTLLFAYIENVSYLITIIGFASAGIAIAMRDWFMSFLGWFVIIIGGAVRVGDRVRFVNDGAEYIGDIIDISLLRMTLLEDVTLTTLEINRRAGRVIFIPNHYIFTHMVANYAHQGLKTVWDGIDFVVTFDSNFNKAANIAKEVAKKYSKGYTDITRKQLNKLRSHYNMKNTNIEPRIFTLISPYGMKISVWYHTNSFATLTLRSTISAEIIDQIHQESDISLAYPTQSIYVDKDARKPAMPPTIPEGNS
ncbi:MAG TPA: mechanosensitive ion channel [Epsilonproteobacteria bacterium]|nr:mechanosensitive ion channel [Campylobacterota bacterium]